MISLLVDECFALDYLSILQVKKDKDSKNHGAWHECRSYLESQMSNKFQDILESKEYADLYDANLKTFEAVAKARSGGNVTAKEVDDCNMLRYNCKVALQTKFFSESAMREVKLS
jgi:hypothetical protein